MNRNAAFFLKGLIIFLTFFSCNKENEDDCPPTDKYLFYIYLSRASGLLTSDLYDTTAFFANVYKSNAGSKMAVLEINGRNIQLNDDGNSRCNDGSHFSSEDEKIPNVLQTGYFLLGQTNTMELTGERCGYISESFKLPDETKLKPLSSTVIHKNQDLVLEFTGGNDYPFPIEILNNDDPTVLFDDISFNIFYSRSHSDTITYPSLPDQNISVGRKLSSTTNKQIRISASELQNFPLNGTVLLQFYRNTQFILPNRDKGELFIQLGQIQGDYFGIKN